MLPSWYPGSYNELQGVFFKEQAEALAQYGHNIGVVAVVAVGIRNIIQHKKCDFSNKIFSQKAVHTYRGQYLDLKSELINRLWRKRIFIKLLELYIKTHGIPDVLHLQSFMLGDLALYAKKRFKIPYVVTEHSSGFFREALTNSEQQLAQKVYEHSNTNMAVSSPLAKVLSDQFKQPFITIGNIVDVDFFSIKPFLKAEQFTFINVAFLDKNKNHAMLIKAFHKAFKNVKSVNLLIVGDGTEKSNLSTLIDDYGMNDQVKLYGRADRKMVKQLLHDSNAFVLSSIFETFGVVIIEAMSCGLPVVATKCGGPEGIIVGDEYGVLSDIDVSPLAQQMLMLYQNYTKYDPQKIRTYVKKHFSQSAICQQLTKIYHKVLQ